jgi:hypothetical protein
MYSFYHIYLTIYCLWQKPYEFPEDGKQLRLKHVGALISKKKLCNKLVLNFIPASFVIMLPKYLKYSAFSGCF